ncbi:Transmembrane protein [Thalictrum thalictroides]|uniref:Transmembrane protein n=1 Tax=Thalictrum thalictroides TaxID=46969 RepID=A0A7J6VT25_THATH|nr:Transmembrane protein [Thalictrum thalictroides]
MSSLQVNVLRSLFCVLGCLMIGTLIYTLYIDGLPFRKELLTPWMAATLVDFYIAILALAAWVSYKVPNWIIAVLWIILLVCLGSVTTCAFILLQLFTFSPQDPLQDPMRYVLVRQHSKNDPGTKMTIFSVMAARILFIALGCLMLGTLIYTILTDGSPFRMELLTPWLTATLVDFYINVVAIAVWIVYKEAHWISALLWIVLLISFGSVTTCAYIVIQLFQLRSQDPLYLVLLNSRDRDGFMMLNNLG